jgi:ribosomal protein S18 acetylase RimI-like enzyme
VSVYRKLGRRVVRLNVYEGNLGALAFYKECGFKVIGSTKGVLGPLMLMEKEL